MVWAEAWGLQLRHQLTERHLTVCTKLILCMKDVNRSIKCMKMCLSAFVLST
jgi:hypothetical protein